MAEPGSSTTFRIDITNPTPPPSLLIPPSPAFPPYRYSSPLPSLPPSPSSPTLSLSTPQSPSTDTDTDSLDLDSTIDQQALHLAHLHCQITKAVLSQSESEFKQSFDNYFFPAISERQQEQPNENIHYSSSGHSSDARNRYKQALERWKEAKEKYWDAKEKALVAEMRAVEGKLERLREKRVRVRERDRRKRFMDVWNVLREG